MALTWETLNEHPSITLLVAAIVSLALGKIISVVIERRKDAGEDFMKSGRMALR